MAGRRYRDLKKFGRSLRARREADGFSQEQLAHDSGLSRNYVGEMERGRRDPTISTLLALAEALGCSPADLLEDAFG